MASRFVFNEFSHLKNPKNFIKQGKIIKKLLDSREKRGRQTQKLSEEVFQPGNINNICNKRMKVLNYVYQTHIADIMTSGKSSFKIKNLGLEVTQVRLNNDYNTVNIYWIAKNNSVNNSEVARILNEIGEEIQQEINGLNLIGQIPKLKFIKDLYALGEIEVVKILDEIKLNNKGASEESVEINKINEKNVLPLMRHDTFGLIHSDIMRRLSNAGKAGVKAETENHRGFIAAVKKIQKFEDAILSQQDFDGEEDYDVPLEDLDDDRYD